MTTIEIELNDITYLVQGECKYLVSYKATYDNDEEGDLFWSYILEIIKAFDEDCQDYDYNNKEALEVLKIAHQRKLEFKL
jgi:hypothetical protein